MGFMKKVTAGVGVFVFIFVMILGPVSALAYNDDLPENAGRYYAFNQFFLDHFAGCVDGDVDYLSNYPCPPGNTTTALASAAAKDRMQYIADNDWIPIAAYSPQNNVMNFYFAGEQNLDYGKEDIIQLDPACAGKPLADFIRAHSESEIKALNSIARAAASFNFYLEYKPEYALPGIAGAQATAGHPLSAVYDDFGDYIGIFDSKKVNVTVGSGVTLKINTPLTFDNLTLKQGSVWDLSALKAEEILLYDNVKKIINEGGEIKFPEGASAGDKEAFLRNVEGAITANTGWLDVASSDWYYPAVQFVTDNELMNGTGENRFSPNLTLNRAMLVTMLYRLDQAPAVSGSLSFPDVEKDQWYYQPILWASQNDIVNGYANGYFGVTDPLTREQAVAVLYRYAEVKEFDVSKQADLNKYSDMPKISNWALDSMRWAVAEGVIQGRPENTIAPQGVLSRAEIATIFKRFIEDFLVKDDIE